MRATALFRKKQMLYPPATSQNGGEKSIEYCQSKTARLAGEGREVFVAAIEIPVNDLPKISSPEPILP